MSVSPPTTAPESPGDGKVVQMTEEALLRLLNEARSGTIFLPPTAYRDQQGQVWRDVLEPTGRMRKNKQTGQMEEVLRKQRRPVLLASDTSREGLIAGRRMAARRSMDFYWPGPPQGVAVGCPEPRLEGSVGWLRNGVKREAEAPANIGSGAESFEMVFTPIEAPEDIGYSTATMQGVAITPDDPTEDTSTSTPQSISGLAGFDEAIASGDVPQEPTTSGRRASSRGESHRD
jgi:hypothetical protein